MILKVKKLHPDAVIPKYITKGSVAFDLHSLYDVALFPNQKDMIETGLAFKLPINHEMQVRQRSGLSIKYPNYIMNSVGTIDTDYRGEVMIPVINRSNVTWQIKYGDRIAQAIVSPIVKCDIEVVDKLSNTERGSGGFGHTGV